MKFNSDFRTALRRRKFDNQLELLGYIYDPTYSEPITEKNEVYISRRWVTLGVFEDEQKAKEEASRIHGLAAQHKLLPDNVRSFDSNKARIRK